jgi:hypothetical protein
MIKKFFDNLKTRKTTAGFAILALIAGFLFLDQSFTGNVVLSDKYSFSIISIIGLLLVFCALMLAIYSVKKK